MLLAALFGFRRMLASDYGLVLKGINDNDRSVINAGINIYWFKTQALFIASAIGGLRRGLHDPCLHVRGHAGLRPGLLHPADCRGGGGRARAPWPARPSAPSSWCPCPKLLRGIGGLRIVFYGLFLVVFIVALPEGIFHYIQRKYHQFERWVEVDRMTAAPLLQVIDLSKAFGGVQALKRVSFELQPGELLGVIGPNGSGKTTLVNLITRFVRPSEGEVRYRGKKITICPPTKSCASALPERFRWSNPFTTCRPTRT